MRYPLLTVVTTLFLILSSNAQELSGPLDGTLMPGSYTLTGNIWVEDTAELTLSAGVTIDAAGPYSFTVYGALHVPGTPDQPVVLTDSTNQWIGLTFHQSEITPDAVQHLIVENSSDNGVLVNGAAPVFDQCTLRNNMRAGLAMVNNATVQFFNGHIHGNGFRGVEITGGSAGFLINNVIEFNEAPFGGGIAVLSGMLNSTQDVIRHNTASGFDQPGGGGIFAVNSPSIQLSQTQVLNNSAQDDDDGGNGGGILLDNSTLIMTGGTVAGNTQEAMDQNVGGGGLCAMNSDVTIIDAVFTENITNGLQLGGAGAGILLLDCTDASISQTLVHNNHTVGEFAFGGGVAVIGGSGNRLEKVILAGNTCDVMGAGVYVRDCEMAELINLTLYDNLNQWAMGDGIYLESTTSIVRNTLVANHDGDGLYFGPESDDSVVEFCDFFGPGQDHLAGNVPGLLGLIYQQNYNGDPSDMYFNIFLDPLLVNPQGLNFSLGDGSPCLDAGDPNTPSDPDGSVVDIGAVHTPSGPVVLQLEPVINEVGPNGGDVLYNLSLESEFGQPVPGITWWTQVTLPNGQTLTQPIEFVPFTLPPLADIFIPSRSLTVPGFAPPGQYTYTGRVGFYPNGLHVQDMFFFSKAAGSAAAGYSTAMADDFAGDPRGLVASEAAATAPLPEDFAVSQAYPNPFNPSTAVRVSLPAASELTATVVNLAGREVARLHDGPLAAGSHTFLWDASGLASGVYFVRVEAEQRTIVRRATLLR